MHRGIRFLPMILDLVRRDPRVKGLQFSRNFGKYYGIAAGLDNCNDDWVVVMDCDLQDRPEEIPRLYAKTQEGYVVVLALRGQRKDPVVKRFTSWLLYKFSYLADMEHDDETGNFRIVSRKVVHRFRTMRERLRFFGGLVAWMGYPTSSIDVQRDERFAGQSTYTLEKLWKLASETVIAYSDKPLRLSIRFGLIISVLAFAYVSYIIYLTLVHGAAIMGWSNLIVSLYFLGGIVISILCMIGAKNAEVFEIVI